MILPDIKNKEASYDCVYVGLAPSQNRAPLMYSAFFVLPCLTVVPYFACVFCSRLEYRRSASIARQFIRCVFNQLSPNGLFPELFRSDNFGKQFCFQRLISLLHLMYITLLLSSCLFLLSLL